MKKLHLLLLFFASVAAVQGQKIIAGPMLGYVTYMEANIWLQLDMNAEVVIEYWDINLPKKHREIKTTKVKKHHIHKVKLEVEPGKSYAYKIEINDKEPKTGKAYTFNTPALWRWRGSKTGIPPDFSFAFGSCNYVKDAPYDRPGASYADTTSDIFNEIVKKNPNFFIWLGDNTYLREPDWTSESGIYYRFKNDRSQANIQNLLAFCPNYAIWDDHDFGPNDAVGCFYNKQFTYSAFNDFWCNPTNGNTDFTGITSAFEYGDAYFFLLDNRYNRVLNTKDSTQHTVLGRPQINWLKQNLLFAPKDEFKFVCVGGQFLNPAKEKENFANYPKERQEIIDWIVQNKIKNVIFLTGDRHHAELSKISINGLDIYDFTASPLTSGMHNIDPTKEKNDARMDSTFFGKDRNFGKISIQGIEENRVCVLELFDKKGTLIWRRKIKK